MTAYAPKTQYKLFMREIAGITDFTTFMSKVEAIWGLDGFLSEFHESGIFNTVVSDTAPSDTTAIWIDPNNPATGATSIVKMHDGSGWVTGTWQLFTTNLISGSPAGASPGTVVPSEESVISSDGETMINPSPASITVGSDTTQAGLTGQGFVTIADYITAAVTVVANSSIQTINGVAPDASGNVDLCPTIPVRTPDAATRYNVFCDATGMGKYQEPDNIYEFAVCAENGSAAPAGLPTTEKTYWATGNGSKILMVKAADGLFYAVNYINIETSQWWNGLVFNGRSDDLCNVNFQNNSWVRMTDEIAPEGSKGYFRANAGNPLNAEVVVYFPDTIIPYSSTQEYKMSYDIRWTETTTTGNIPGSFYVFLAPHDRDGDVMGRLSFFPSPYGSDYEDYIDTGNITPQSIATCGPNVFLTAPLNPGDTVLKLNDVSFWDNNNNHFYRFLRFLNFKDFNGNDYFDYSQNFPAYRWSWYSADTNDWGMFDSGSINITLNQITLSEPWSGDSIPAGTRVANSHIGGIFYYPVAEPSATHSAIAGSGDWRKINITVGNLASGIEPFPLEVAGVKLGIIWNSQNTSSPAEFHLDFANVYLDKV